MSRGRDIIRRMGEGAALSAALLCIGAALPSPAASVRIMEYESNLQVASNQERSIRPAGVTWSNGDICVTDAQYAALHILNEYGVEIFETSGFAELSYPVDGSLTSDGDMVFIGRNAQEELTIRRLSFMGEPMDFKAESPVERWTPWHLALARDGNILTVDSFHNILTKHDAQNGRILWSTPVVDDASTEPQLGRPAEAPDGRIYVPSGMLHRILFFSEDGRRLGEFGEFGSGPGKLVFPVGVAIGPEQSILVLDRMRHKVLMFSPEHELLGEFGSMGAAPGQFYHPSAIAASSDGKVYVAQGYGGRVQVFNIHNTEAE